MTTLQQPGTLRRGVGQGRAGQAGTGPPWDGTYPGATRSGLKRPSEAGPLDEKYAKPSEPKLPVLEAPTQIAFFAVAGAPMLSTNRHAWQLRET